MRIIKYQRKLSNSIVKIVSGYLFAEIDCMNIIVANDTKLIDFEINWRKLKLFEVVR